jgi:hypothetical protein
MEKQPRKQDFWDNRWIKGMGIGAFAFFLVKGLIWLAVFFGLFNVVNC